MQYGLWQLETHFQQIQIIIKTQTTTMIECWTQKVTHVWKVISHIDTSLFLDILIAKTFTEVHGYVVQNRINL